ncbi:DNA-binding protein WhiA [Euzebya sp.]|uniref:DNA-binding protein WhiA n=1 Tax=Euzebya sp. TaxID=1971409 RepID=UPI00351366F9
MASLTRPLREELAHRPAPEGRARVAETAAMVRFGGSLRLRGGGPSPQVSVVVRCAQGSVARRLRTALIESFGLHPGLARDQGGNLAGSAAYLVEVGHPALGPLGILDDGGRPREGTGPLAADHRSAYLAGALMVAGRLSGAGAPVHLEVAAPGERTAHDLGALIGAAVHGTRVVVKDGDAVTELLGEVGARETLAAFEEGRVRRDLRRQVTRSVNADRANLRRTADAAAAQIGVVERLVAAVGWDGLPEDVRATALVRVANPEASLADLGALLDPPVGKATVHRRLQRLEALLATLAADT